MNKKEQIWMAVFIVLPFSLLWPISEYFAEPGLTRTLISAILGGLGGLLGFILYSICKTRTTTVKIIALTVMLAVGLTGIHLTHLSSSPALLTCEICGYKAIETGKSECKFCGSDTWEVAKNYTHYDNKEEWLRDEQLFWFGADDTKEINLYGPATENGFEKDKTWKPIITKQDVINASEK